MGTSTSAAQLATKFTRLAVGLADNKPALIKTGMAGKDIYAQARKRKVSGSTPISKKVKERFDLRPGEVIIRYTGPAHLLNNPTAPHFIASKKLGGSRRSRSARASRIGAMAAFGGSNRGAFGGKGRGALTINGSLRAYAFHPGTKGLKFHDDAKREAYRKLPDVYRKAGLTEPLRKAFAA